MIILIISTTWLWVIGGLTTFVLCHEAFGKPESYWRAVMLSLFWPIAMSFAFAYSFVDAILDIFYRGGIKRWSSK